MYMVVYIYELTKETGLFGGNMKLKFQKVYEEQKHSVYAYLLYMTKDVQLAEDLSQETFLKIFLNLGRFKEECSVKTWTLRIARNTFVTYARKKRPELLKEQDRTILLLREYENLSYEEIAMILETNVGVVKSRIYRARKKFKELYQHERRCGENV